MQTKTIEKWKDIEGYEGWYQVSTLGNVKSLKRRHNSHGHWCVLENERILKQSLYGKGYYCIRLAPVNGNGKKQCFSIHRLVAQAFIPNPNNLPQVDHINRDKKDNRVENLRWVTMQENIENMDRNVNITAFGKTKTITSWSRECGLSVTAIKIRLRNGWNTEDALTIPPTDNSTRTQFFGKRGN